MNRYNRHIILSDVGQEGQDKLLKAKVLVVGAGGLGCPVLQYLAGAGIGTIGIIDFDIVEVSNLQRQVLFGTTVIGINKAIAAKQRLEDLNPTIIINAIAEKLTKKNALEIFRDYDIIVDGTDNFATRYLINDIAVFTNKPIVYGAIYKFEGQVSVFNFNKGPSYRCLFPSPPKEGSVANCSEVGVLGVLPGIIGTMMANEVLKIILGLNDVLSGKLLCYSSRTTGITTIKINKNEKLIDEHLKKTFKSINEYEDQSYDSEIKEIASTQLLQFKDIQYIDVRKSHEEPKIELSDCLKIPLGELEKNLNQIDTSKTIVVFCQSGIRSKKAIEIFNRKNITNCYNLKGGVLTIIEQLKVKFNE